MYRKTPEEKPEVPVFPIYFGSFSEGSVMEDFLYLELLFHVDGCQKQVIGKRYFSVIVSIHPKYIRILVVLIEISIDR